MGRIESGLASILHVATTPVTDDEYGQLRDAQLVIQGRLLPIHSTDLEFWSSRTTDSNLAAAHPGWPPQITPDFEPESLKSSDPAVSNNRFLVLPLSGGHDTTVCCLRGLVVQEIPGRSVCYSGVSIQPVYQRVAYFEMNKTKAALDRTERGES